MRHGTVIGVFVGGIAWLCHPTSCHALEGLKQLQQAARYDQATECMIHEYTRQYNEVLRGYSAKRRRLTPELEADAHARAIAWVRSVWMYADQDTVERAVTSEQFTAAINTFRVSQRLHYPQLGVVP